MLLRKSFRTVMSWPNKRLYLHRIRAKIAVFVSRLLLGRMAGLIPYSIIGDAHEVVDRPEYREVLDVVRLIDDAYTEEYFFPDFYPYRFPRKKAYYPKYLYFVKNALVTSRSGLVMLPAEKKAFLQSIGSLNRLLGWGNILPEMLAGADRPERIMGDVVVCPDTGYFHWLLEVMPNVIHSLKFLGTDAKVIIPANPPKYVLGALAHILGPKWLDRVVRVSLAAHTERVYFATFEDRSGYVRAVDIAVLKEAFGECLSSLSKTRKIYISRAKSPKRTIGNELEIERVLRTYGYEIVYAEELSFKQQIALFSSATHIVAPHGAGLANIVWCKPGTKLLEIFPYNNLHFCYATLASTGALGYSFLECEYDAQSSGCLDIKKLSIELGI